LLVTMTWFAHHLLLLDLQWFSLDSWFLPPKLCGHILILKIFLDSNCFSALSNNIHIHVISSF
jgi:hypothetical protein